jgi:hypothetical protein
MLIDRTRNVQERLPPTDRARLGELNLFIRRLETECRQGHAAYLHARPATLRLCENVMAATMPRPTAVA